MSDGRKRKLMSGLAGAAALAAGSQAYAQGTAVSIAPPPDIPAPVPPNSSATINWNADGVGANDFTFLFRFPNSTQVHWQSNNDRFFCPCHNGAFDKSGQPISGPPKDSNKALPRYPLKIEKGLLFIEVPTEALV